MIGVDHFCQLKALYESNSPSITLLFSHPELWRDISNKGLPIVSSAPFSQQTHLSILQTSSLKVYSQLYMQTSSWVTFRQHTRQCTDLLLGHMPGMMTIWINLFHPLLKLLSQQLQLEFVLLYGLIMQTVLGFKFWGMALQSTCFLV